MRKARVLITERCLRLCAGCCNKYERIMQQMIAVPSLEFLEDGYDIVCLTGGEPMLEPEYLLTCIEACRAYGVKFVYVYTALYVDHYFEAVIGASDGIHFTLHAPASTLDIGGLAAAQDDMLHMALAAWRPKTHRLYVDNRIVASVPIIPSAWSRVDISPWLTEEEVFRRNGPTGLPPGEELYLLKGAP